MFIYFERERACMSRGEAEREGERERERERIPSGFCTASTEPDMGLEPMNREIMT